MKFLINIRLIKFQICEEIVSDLLKIPESADFIDLVDKKKVLKRLNLMRHSYRGCLSIHNFYNIRFFINKGPKQASSYGLQYDY